MARAPDGSHRLFLAAKNTGRIRYLNQDIFSPLSAGQLGPIHSRDEAGLLGLVADPASSSQFYAFLTVSEAEQQIQRITLAGDQVIEVTPLILELPTRG